MVFDETKSLDFNVQLSDLIFEIGVKPIPEEKRRKYIRPFQGPTTGSSLFFASRERNDFRAAAIEWLHNQEWFGKLFKSTDKEDVIELIPDGVENVKRAWYKKLAERVKEMERIDTTSVGDLLRTAHNPFGLDHALFILAHHTYGIRATGREENRPYSENNFLDFLDTRIKPGDKLYIGAVFVYNV